MTQDIRDELPETAVQAAEVSVFEQVAAWLQANDMSYSENPEGRYFALRITGEHADFQMTIDAAGELPDARLLVLAWYPVRVPEARRPAVADLLARINRSTWLGCMALDSNDGVVSVRTALPVDDGALTERQLEHVFYSTVNLADRYLPGVCATAFGGAVPDLAFEMGQAPAPAGLQ